MVLLTCLAHRWMRQGLPCNALEGSFRCRGAGMSSTGGWRTIQYRHGGGCGQSRADSKASWEVAVEAGAEALGWRIAGQLTFVLPRVKD